ncbi:TRAP transporter substrate-binding protein DctP [Pusillimonas sp. SM2304]|uniref:TRAP transporter substrate-binding protein DctP n=1 Tax=Pusillimonas sp. SM2304 TaxID=3073241 RepID=UPI0028768576|nr:TRAP transporter substrate-binding protein DctP [Pusillimonas sp. SM2304]MDS1139384.1 TRAP transporter substrate-binding protein DctP [Pusillimonas sp. SM2304]
MNHWKFLSALSLLAGLWAPSAMAAEPVVLKFSHEAPEQQAKGRTASYFAEKVAELSGGSLKIEVFPGAQLIPTKDEVRAAMRGQVDIIAPQTSYFVPFDDSWDVFYLPLLFDNALQGMEIIQGELGREMLGTLSRNRLHGLGIWHDGPGFLFTRETPVTKPADLAGRKIRVFPSAPLEAGVRAAKGIPVSMPGPDVYLGLQQGLIEGVISAVTFAAPSRWYEVTKAATRMTMFVGGYGIVINEARWKSLSDEHKRVIQEAMALSEKWNFNHAVENIAASEKLLTDNGVTIADLTEEDLADWRAAMKPVYDAQPDSIKQRIAQVEKLKSALKKPN